MPQLPVILTAFANSYDEAYLSHLEKEHDRLLDILAPLSYLRHIPLSSAKTGQLVSTLTQYQKELLILHFGGHADGSQLHFKDAGGQVAGLAENLSLHPQLKLVFLNGCNTQAQAVQYLDAGVPAVIATTCSVADGQAMQFAEVFYTALAKGHTLEEAFVRAKGAMKLVDGGTYEDEILNWRGLRLRQEPIKEVPWRLYFAGDDVLGWKLEMVEDKVKSLPILLNNVPTNFDPKTDCIGRETDLDELQQMLSNSPKVALVRGLGGIGKTTLAQAYVALYQKHYQHMIWVTQGSDLVRTIALDRSLAQSLNMPFQADEDLETRFGQLMQILRTIPGPNLLVIDNATEQVAQRDIVQQLPNAPHWKVLVTSRQDLPDFVVLELHELEPDAALKLFRLYYQGSTDEEVMELLDEIGYHTLTTELLAKTLQHKRGLLSIPKLLDKLREGHLDDPKLAVKLWARHSGEEKGVFNYLMRLFELADLNDKEIWVMQQFAVLPALPLEVAPLAEWLEIDADELNQILNELADKGWLSIKEDTFLVHRLMQEVVKYQKEPDIEELEQLVDAMANKMTTSEFGNPVIENLPWLEYAKKVADYFTSHTHLPEKAAILWNNLANLLSFAGDFKVAVQLLERVLLSYTHLYGPDNIEVAGIKSNLALNYMDLDNLKLAAQLLEEALDTFKENYGLEHSETTLILGNLAEVHQALGEYEKAKLELETVLRVETVIFGDDHPRVSTIRANLANVLRFLGEHPQAIKLYKTALKNNIKTLGVNHPSVALGYLNLANVLSDIGEFKKARNLAKKGLKLFISIFGNNHPDVAKSKSTLGNILNLLGKAPRAIELLRQALESNIQNFGEDSLLVAQARSNLADLLRKNGNIGEAIDLYKKALEIHLLKYDPQHPFIAQSSSNLAVGYRAIGKLKEAKELLESALKSDINSFGENHPNVARRQANLAMVFSDLGRGDLAMELMEKALKNIEQNHGREHHEFAVNIWNRGIIFFSQRVYSQAKVDFEKALKIIEKTLGVNHPHYAAIVSWLDAANEKLNPSS